MDRIDDFLCGLARPILVALIVLVGLGVVSASGSPVGRAGSTTCIQIFADPGFNRTVCRLSPARLLRAEVPLGRWMGL
ncbi:hypothetical protein [Tropicimonas sp. IMCC34011]|uniref:hypothetical protein n=1 Tax=Tropicimonas sp. IMCC34011 TaxID=2248759 RepID=UPI000E280FB3|nr:hypothetical protein [Tropicimonas sp. IMCC34011]